jgi:hypothetical protein
MTDEEEARVRDIIEREVQALTLKVEFRHEPRDIDFVSDMQWHYPRAYRRISTQVREQYNLTDRKLDKLRAQRGTWSDK